MLKNFWKFLSKSNNQDYDDVYKIIDNLKQEENSIVFLPNNNILDLIIIMNNHIWKLNRLNNENIYYIKEISKDENDISWKNALVSMYFSQSPQIVSHDMILEVLFDFLVRNAHIYKLSAIDLTAISSSVCLFINEHKSSNFKIDEKHLNNLKNVWID